MKNFLVTIITATVMSLVTLQLTAIYDLPFGKSYSGTIVKDTSTKVIQERVEEYKKTSNMESDVTKAVENGLASVVSIITSKDLDTYMTDPFGFYFGQPLQQAKPIKQKTQKIKVGGGSGIIISKDGYILTSKHVVSDNKAEYTVLTNDGDTLTVKKIRRDPVLDIAILQTSIATGTLPTDLQPASFVSYTSPIHVGQFTIAIGNTLTEYANSATFGIISAKNRSIKDLGIDEGSYMGMYQTDTPMNPGNSGGPLLNTAGEVIGISTSLAQGDGIGFVLPLTSEFIQTTLSSIAKSDSIQRPYIGVSSKSLTKSAAKNLDMKKFEGVYVQSVEKGSPAEIGGLLSGDVITEINNTSVQPDMPLLYTLYTLKPGDIISLLVYRGKEYKKMDITLGSGSQTVQ